MALSWSLFLDWNQKEDEAPQYNYFSYSTLPSELELYLDFRRIWWEQVERRLKLEVSNMGVMQNFAAVNDWFASSVSISLPSFHLAYSALNLNSPFFQNCQHSDIFLSFFMIKIGQSVTVAIVEKFWKWSVYIWVTVAGE